MAHGLLAAYYHLPIVRSRWEEILVLVFPRFRPSRFVLGEVVAGVGTCYRFYLIVPRFSMFVGRTTSSKIDVTPRPADSGMIAALTTDS